MVKNYFSVCEVRFPGRRAELRRISLALRREGIGTMEELCLLRQEGGGKLLSVRAIGEKSLALIEQICTQYETECLENRWGTDLCGTQPGREEEIV